MKIDALKPGDQVVIGTKRELADGTGGTLYGYKRSGKTAELNDASVSVKVPVSDMRKLEAVGAWLDWLQEPSPAECRLP